jgi:tetratricopeptide (TPR) repeat protein
MKFTTAALSALLVSAAIAAPATAQSRGSFGKSTRDNATAQNTKMNNVDVQEEERKKAADATQPKASREALKALQALQAAVEAKDAAAFPTALASAKAAAKTPGDRYLVGAFQYKYALATTDNSQKAAGLEAMIASGFNALPKEQLYADLGNTYSALNQTDKAIAAYKQSLALNPADIAAIGGLAEALADVNRAAEAMPILKKGIAAQEAGGQKAPEQWYKRAVAIAYNAKLQDAVELSREWVTAYPTSANWSDAVRVYESLAQLDETRHLDALRLLSATGALKSEADYYGYADIALRKGLSGEAKAVLEKGFAAGQIQRDSGNVKQLYDIATTKTKGDEESLPDTPSASATGRATLSTGDAYFGYGEYAKAAEFYRAAVGKSDVGADLVNLHLGMTLASSGDKAGAKAALDSIGPGPYQQLAKYWLLYLDTRP